MKIKFDDKECIKKNVWEALLYKIILAEIEPRPTSKYSSACYINRLISNRPM